MADLTEAICAVVAAKLVEFTGECACDEAYTLRSLLDPHCAWHNAGGDEFAAETASAVSEALTEGGSVEWGVRRVGYPEGVRPQTEERARWIVADCQLEGHPEEVVSRTVGPWKEA